MPDRTLEELLLLAAPRGDAKFREHAEALYAPLVAVAVAAEALMDTEPGRDMNEWAALDEALACLRAAAEKEADHA